MNSFMNIFKSRPKADGADGVGMDDVTETLVMPMDMDLPLVEEAPAPDKTMETASVNVASYMSVGTRKNQQDSLRFDGGDDRVVCVLCDGMGGLSGGERASALAAGGMLRHLLGTTGEDIPTEIGRAALRLNSEVRALTDPQGKPIEAGTTLTVIYIRNGQMFWSNIGDSHIYLCRDGKVEQLNIDHNLGTHLDQLVQNGQMTQEEAMNHPQRAALTSYLGITELTLIGGNRTPMTLQKDDVIIQCSDGLYRCMSDEDMAQVLAVAPDLKTAARTMVENAVCLPGPHDNTSVVLTRYKG